MRRTQLHLLRLPAIVLAGLALVPGTVISASADAEVTDLLTRAVPVAHPAAMVYAHGHLFVSGDDAMTVLDSNGTVVATIPDLPGAGGLVRSASGKEVYVALHDANAVAVVDTATLAVSRRLSVDACPDYLALVDGRLYFSSSCTNPTEVASIDPVDGGLVVSTGIRDFYDRTPIAGAGHRLVGAWDQSSIHSYAVDGSTVTPVATRNAFESVTGLVTSADGETTYDAVIQSQVQGLPTDTLVPAEPAYTGEAFVRSLAISPDGTFLAAGYSSPSAANLRVWTIGTADPVVAGIARPAAEYNPPGGLRDAIAFADDSSTVYELVGGGPTGTVYLTSARTRPAAPVESVLTLSVEQPATPGGYATLRVVLADQPGAQVDLAFESGGATRHDMVVTGSDGIAVDETTVTPGTRVTAAFAGDDGHRPATSQTVTIKDATTLRLGKVSSPSGRTGTVRTTATLAVPRAGVPITFTLEQPGQTLDDVVTRTTVVPTDANGVATLSRKVSTGGRVGAAYAGDEAHQPSASTKAFWTVASTTRAALAGKHQTAHGKLSYTEASRVRLDVDVDPTTAEQVDVALQQKSGSHWRTTAESTEDLDHGGLTLQLDRAPAREDLRFVVVFGGDHATRGSSATTKTFRIG